jgi:NDP-sugar pyrophosphorylase family protein
VTTGSLELPPVAVLAGGLGTRLGAAAQGMPKALVPVAGQPFVFHQLRSLAQHGVTRVVLCVGYKGELVEEAVGTSCYSMRVEYSRDGPEPEGTLSALERALPLLGPEFLFLYGDTYLRIDYRAVARRWRSSGKPALLTVLRNQGRWGPSNADYVDGAVLRYDKRNPTPDMSWIDYGLGGLTLEAMKLAGPATTDLADLLSLLAGRGQLFGVRADRRFYEIGTPQSLRETDRFLRRHRLRSPAEVPS